MLTTHLFTQNHICIPKTFRISDSHWYSQNVSNFIKYLSLFAHISTENLLRSHNKWECVCVQILIYMNYLHIHLHLIHNRKNHNHITRCVCCRPLGVIEKERVCELSSNIVKWNNEPNINLRITCNRFDHFSFGFFSFPVHSSWWMVYEF